MTCARLLMASWPVDVDARRLQRLDLREQRRRIDHQPVADDRLDSRAQNPDRDQLQDELLVADAHRVAGVVAALIARHDVEAFREQIDDLAFAFVAPLRAQHNQIVHRSELKTPHCIAGGVLRWPGCCFLRFS